MSDPFLQLGLDASASEDEVRSAFKKLARTTHPDVGGTAEDWAHLEAAYREALALAQKLKPRACQKCEGTGYTTFTQGFYVSRRNCTACRGLGKV